MGDEMVAVVLRGPWIGRMSETEFLSWLLGRLEGQPVRVVEVPLVDLQLDIVLPVRPMTRAERQAAKIKAAAARWEAEHPDADPD